MILDDILYILKNKSQNKAYTINKNLYTYSEFYKMVCNIYNYLLENYTNAKNIVVFGHKEIYMKATFLACSFAGKTYIPLDNAMPSERINLILNAIKPDLVVGNIDNNYPTIEVNRLEKIMSNILVKEIDKIYLKEDDIYYIIFTSGSTGIPKGVKVTYSNLNSCINWLKNITNVEKTVILNQANFSFDLSVADLYLSLVTESEQFIIESNKLDYKKMFEELKDSKAELAIMTPSFAELLLIDKKFDKNLMNDLKEIIFCGEKLINSTVKELFCRFPGLKIINCYGPTECTFAVTSVDIVDLDFNNDIPVGISKPGVEIAIVDEDLKKLEENEIGEILIIGDSVAAGYINDIKNKSFIKYNNTNAYLTGDFGYLKNGMLYYVARKDSQIKYKGYRIDLLDIEENLYKLEIFNRVEIVSLKDANDMVTKIVAFVKLKNNIKKDIFEVKAMLKQKLPEYMCPVIKIVEEFPVNNNGKCDKKLLLEMMRDKNGE